MGLDNFNKQIEESVVNPALAKQSGLKSGIIVNSIYETNTDMSSYDNGGGVILDIILYDETGESNEVIKQVPLVKTPGIQQSLPPVGSTAIIAFLDGDVSRPVCIGILTNYVTNQYTRDHLSPRIPPKKI